MQRTTKFLLFTLMSVAILAVLAFSASATIYVNDAKKQIFVESGRETLDNIYKEVEITDAKLWNVTGTEWILNYSIQINQTGILDLSKATNCNWLKLNNDSTVNVNISVLGKLFVNDTRISAWDQSEDALADEFDVYTPFPKPYILIISVDEVVDATHGEFNNATVEWLGWEETNEYGITWVDVGVVDPTGRVDECTFINNTVSVFLDGITKFEINDSTFTDTHDSHIKTTGTTTYIWINGTTFTGDNSPVSCNALETGVNDDYIFVNTCTVTDVSHGFDLSGDLGTFTSVDFVDCDYSAIGLDGNNNTFTTCTIGGTSAGWGVYMNSDGIDNVFEDCTIASSSNCFYLNYKSEVVVNNGSLICTGDHTIEAVDNCTIALYNVSDLYNNPTANRFTFHIESACALTYQGYWLVDTTAYQNLTATDAGWWATNFFEIPAGAWVGDSFRNYDVIRHFIEPSTGFANATLGTYTANNRIWTVDAEGATDLTQRIGGLTVGQRYYRYVDDVQVSDGVANANGFLNFPYTGTWTEHEFRLTLATIETGSPNYIAMISLVLLILVILGTAFAHGEFDEAFITLIVVAIIIAVIGVGLVFEIALYVEPLLGLF